MPFDQETQDLIVQKTNEIRAALNGFKAEFEAKGAGAEERLKRLEEGQAKAANDETIRGIVKELISASERDQTNRHVDLIPTVDYSTRAARAWMENAKSKEEIRRVYDMVRLSRPIDEKTRQFQIIGTKLSLLKGLLSQGGMKWNPEQASTDQARMLWYQYRALQQEFFGDALLQRAVGDLFDSADSSEWIPSLMSAELLRYLEIYGTLIPAVRTAPMSSPTWKWPITKASDKARLMPEGASYTTSLPAHTASTYAGKDPIGGVTFTAKKLRAYFGFSEELLEDSIVSMLDWALEDLAAAQRRAIEDAMINGDTDTPAIDSDLSFSATDSSYSNRIAWKGFRELARANSATFTASGGNMTTANISDTLRKMGRYAVNPSNNIILCGVKSYLDLVDEGNIVTLDKVGSRATILTGSVGVFLGRNVLVNEFVREDLNASGQYDGTTTNNTVAICFDRTMWGLGNYRGIRSERERNAFFDQHLVYTWWRGDFQKLTTSTETTEAVLVDLTSA
jgi:HK97 family phage major capsid protein